MRPLVKWTYMFQLSRLSDETLLVLLYPERETSHQAIDIALKYKICPGLEQHRDRASALIKVIAARKQMVPCLLRELR